MPGSMTKWGTVGVTLVALAAVPSCGPAAGAENDETAAVTTTPPPDPQLLITFDDQEQGSAAGRDIIGEGSAAAEISLLSRNKQKATFVAGHQGGIALRTPPYSGESSGSFSALRIEPEEWLSPGLSDFTFGADVRLDAKSNGTAIDNGDNVMQRGLYADAAQYKIQVDKHHASCVIRGTDGAVVVKSKALLTSSKWYRLTCHRSDKTVKLTVQNLETNQPPETLEKTGPIGTLDMIGSEPLSVGAKIGEDGEIIGSSTDQFNGLLDNISYERS
ncbi:laminin G domain protein [Kribbella voronezhensis]|uniref:Laminin G domain protein n=1 Tax=Kribbella voronezhensis TaxID=2512212 RepID=A0A4R7T5Z3_9ACTN|nr:LamG domain-containing protein [Kribbella voronezhensis]TDU87105.1 laminin G domain protein [Kribbella voronezhensis]